MANFIKRLSSSYIRDTIETIKRNSSVRPYSSSSSSPSPLDGVTVLDLTRIVAGPYCTQLLGDLGARVVKLEHPRGGDEARRWAPPHANRSAESCYFLALNRNKRSACVDMKTEAGAKLVRELAKASDVLVENFVPGKLDALGLGYERLSEEAPRLIYCSVTGYGARGPYAKRPGYDVIAASVGGLLSITGEQNGPPVKVGVAVTDMMTGLHAHGAIMAALLLRERTGLGQKIDCDLLSTQVAALINLGSNYLNAGAVAGRYGTAHPSIVPYETFPTRDGHLTVGAGSDKQFEALCARLNIGDVAEDEKYSTNSMRVKNRKSLIGMLKDIFAKKSTDDWLEVLEGAPFPYGPVNTIDRVFADPHIKDIGLVEEMEHPVAGRIKVVGPPTKFSGNGNRVRFRPPLLGEHTDEVLQEMLGYDERKISQLREDKIIF